MKQKGLTLIEVLIAIAIAVIVSGLLVIVVVNSLGLYHKESSTLTQGLNINDALSQIRGSIKEASSIDSSSNATSLDLKLPALDVSNNIIANTYDRYVFFLDQNQLRFKTYPDILSARKMQDRIFSTSVVSLTFNYLDSQNPPNEVAPTTATKVRISLTLEQKKGIDLETYSATSEASLRND